MRATISALFDAHPPREVAARVVAAGETKASRDTLSLLVLSGLAGAFVSLGALLFAVVISGSTLGFGPTRLLGGAAFSLGLVLVVIAGAELFTGNNLLVMSWASRRISTATLLRSWALTFAGNFVGATATAILVFLAGVHDFGDGVIGRTLSAIAAAKMQLPPIQAFILGIFCNALVCLAVWLAMAGRSVTDKILAIMLPISAFVAVGFEHSIANLFFLPLAMLIAHDFSMVTGALLELAWVTAGNIIGGAGFVAAVYWIVYVRQSAPKGARP